MKQIQQYPEGAIRPIVPSLYTTLKRTHVGLLVSVFSSHEHFKIEVYIPNAANL